MSNPHWSQELPLAITVCDRDGIILEMNDRSALTFAQDGGRELIGKSLLDCHPEPSRSKLMAMLKSPAPNTYTIEKAGVKKLIHQTPWFQDGGFAGIVEFSLEIPWEMPHFVRG